MQTNLMQWIECEAWGYPAEPCSWIFLVTLKVIFMDVDDVDCLWSLQRKALSYASYAKALNHIVAGFKVRSSASVSIVCSQRMGRCWMMLGPGSKPMVRPHCSHAPRFASRRSHLRPYHVLSGSMRLLNRLSVSICEFSILTGVP